MKRSAASVRSNDTVSGERKRPCFKAPELNGRKVDNLGICANDENAGDALIDDDVEDGGVDKTMIGISPPSDSIIKRSSGVGAVNMGVKNREHRVMEKHT